MSTPSEKARPKRGTGGQKPRSKPLPTPQSSQWVAHDTLNDAIGAWLQSVPTENTHDSEDELEGSEEGSASTPIPASSTPSTRVSRKREREQTLISRSPKRPRREDVDEETDSFTSESSASESSDSITKTQLSMLNILMLIAAQRIAEDDLVIDHYIKNTWPPETTPRRPPGSDDIDAAVKDCKSLFGIKGAQLARFTGAIKKPLQAVVWNALGDRDAKVHFLKQILDAKDDNDTGAT